MILCLRQVVDVEADIGHGKCHPDARGGLPGQTCGERGLLQRPLGHR